ncbi:lipooligosaccharide transport system permease protein [Nocardioides alpinus]|uniref:ABC transporter n=1 Tax=Nocardioides alpinus TaxID=748909 RepID=A0A1I1B6H9_9ACTN|nr:ABC transporter permease [Nocardioides alpinus]PKH41305.1 ABC transporter [Nocardioides alpinus]SFB45975.1 lipooligosaccharide transport system permease protein [Nocardioides alpinus]
MATGTTPSTSRPTAGPTGSLSVVEGVARQYDYWATVYKRTWRGGVVNSFATPLFYVVAMGVLLGGFIEGDPDQLEGATSYLAFVVPGLVAAHAMTMAVSETTYPVMGAIKWHKTFYAQLATPLAVRDLVNAFLLFVLFRVASACAVFMLVLAPFGVFETWWGPLLAWLSQVLVGMAFATLVFGYSARLRSEEGFGVLFRLGVLPLTLFSGAFFPITNLGPVLEWVARLTPLWHGVSLSRMFCLDTVDWRLAAVNVGVLVVLSAVGWRWAVTGLDKRLEV